MAEFGARSNIALMVYQTWHASLARCRARVMEAYWPGLRCQGEVRLHRGVTISVEPGGTILLQGTQVLPGCVLQVSSGATLQIGASILGRGVVIAARDSILIGDRTGIADMSTIRDHDHTWSLKSGSDRTSWETSPIVIGDDAWIGAKSTVTKGVVIGSKVVVGAGGVVTRAITASGIYGGVPARRIK